MKRALTNEQCIELEDYLVYDLPGLARAISRSLPDIEIQNLNMSIRTLSPGADEGYHQALEFIAKKLEEGPMSLYPSLNWARTQDGSYFTSLSKILASAHCTLKSLSICDCNVTDDFFKTVPNDNLVELHLSKIPVDGEDLAQFIKNSKNLKFIDLFYIKFENETRFLEAIPLCKNLRELSLAFCGITVPIAKHVNQSSTLRSLEFMISLPEDGIQIIAGNSTLTNLDISFNYDVPEAEIISIFDGFKVNKTLERFSLDSDAVIKSLGTGLRGNSSLKSLLIESASTNCIHELLSYDNAISSLDAFLISEFVEFPKICDFVRKTTSIKSLTLFGKSRKKCDEEKQILGNELFSALFDNCSIREFTCFFLVPVDKQCAEGVAKLFKEKPQKLTKYHFRGTKISPEATPIIFDSLLGNSTLQSLAIDYGSPDTSSLEKFIESTTTLQELKIFAELLFSEKFAGLSGGIDCDSLLKSLVNNVSLTAISFPFHVKSAAILKEIANNNQGTFLLAVFFPKVFVAIFF